MARTTLSIAAALAALAALVAAPARAEVAANGLSANGLTANGTGATGIGGGIDFGAIARATVVRWRPPAGAPGRGPVTSIRPEP